MAQLVAKYIRLSREDGDKDESNSVGNQRKILDQYLESKSDLIVIDEYIDDGYTGTNFDRPEFKRMIKDIESKKINCVIVKDLSRLGRDYIDTGYYLEKFFVRNQIRFIALGDNIDTVKNKNNAPSIEVPIKNVINDYYAQDISNKVRNALDAKRKEGEFIGAFAPYGYEKDSDNRNNLVIDEKAADVVRMVFKLYLEGYTQQGLARYLNSLDILPPTLYKKSKNQKYMNAKKLPSTNYWTYSTIRRMLKNEVYIGNMIQKKYQTMSYKVKKHMTVPDEDQIRVENTHEPVIDMETWELVQKNLKLNTKVLKNLDKPNLFAGIFVCADCGRAMSIKKTGKNQYYVCGSYRKFGKDICSSHSINYNILYDAVLMDINDIIKSLFDESRVYNGSKSKESSLLEYSLQEAKKALEKTMLLKRSIYEDWKLGEISKQDFHSFKTDYDQREKELKDKIIYIEKALLGDSDENDMKNAWLEILKEYKEIKELDRIVLGKLIDKISINEDKEIDIAYHFDGMV